MKAGIRIRSIPAFTILTCAGIILCFPPGASAGDVGLAWDPNTQPELAGYWLLHGRSSGQYSKMLDVGNVTACTVSNLGPGKHYFSVRAYGRAGQVSPYSNEAVAIIPAVPDSRPPLIGGVASASVGMSSAKIIWTTDEPSDSQIVYGATAAYGGSTQINPALTLSHSQNLTGLAAGTTYHYRVKSIDAAGNPSVSGDYTFTTASQAAPPVISAITVSKIAEKSATISWLTDRLADSEVVYWSTGADAAKSARRTLDTAHSLTLNGLHKLTRYQFRVKCIDAEGNEAVTPELTFTTTGNDAHAVIWPRFSAGQDVLGTDTAAGLALANLGDAPANVTLTAMEGDGSIPAGKYISNPVIRALAPQTQVSILDWQLLGIGLSGSNSRGWIKIESGPAEINGLFQIFDDRLNLMAGANLSDTPLTDFAFTEIQPDGYNKINVVNDNSKDADVVFHLVRADGMIRSSRWRLIPANGALAADLFGDLFAGIEPDPGEYVRVQSSRPLHSLLIMRQKSGDIAALAGQDTTAGGTTLYSPQYAFGGAYRTSISIVNLDPVAGTVLLRLIREDGIQLGATRSVVLPPNGKLFVEDPSFFHAAGGEVVKAGYVAIIGDGIRLAGSTVFGDINRQTFFSALALVSTLHRSVLFSHMASDPTYFTGMAILNPNDPNLVEATVAIELYAADGTLVESKRRLIGPGKREAFLLTQFFPSLEGKSQPSGYIRLISDRPVACFALFGTHNLSVMSAIPQREIQ